MTTETVTPPDYNHFETLVDSIVDFQNHNLPASLVVALVMRSATRSVQKNGIIEVEDSYFERFDAVRVMDSFGINLENRFDFQKRLGNVKLQE